MIQINDISDLFDFSLYYQGCEPPSDSTEASPPPSSPPTHLPDSPESSASTLSDSTNPRSPALTEEEEVHYNNVIFYGVDSPVLPLQSPTHIAGMSPTPASSPSPFALSPTITNIPSPAVSAASSPRTSFSATISSPAVKRSRSLTVEPSESEPGPSTPNASTSSSRLTKRVRISVPGESAFQLDVQVPAFTSSTPSGPPMGKTRQRVDYSACKCRNRTSKPARHWKTACPYNPDRSTNRVSCELCEMTFSRHDNMDRHMADYH
ncbi:hypothetical protein FRC04_009053 [Tulasnella sp. 424]|nr:hypothetical protein FRC04_009053 [Tulasnella sp. 424]